MQKQYFSAVEKAWLHKALEAKEAQLQEKNRNLWCITR